MKIRLLVMVAGVSLLAFSGCATAHGPGRSGYDNDWSGSVTIWSGAPHAGYAGSLHYGSGYYAPHRYAPSAFYPECGHWHPPGYRHARGYGYRKGYAHSRYQGRHHHGKHRNDHHRHHH